MSEDRVPFTNEQIDLAYKVLRVLADGHEPYGPAVLPMARRIADPEQRLGVVADLCTVRDKRHAFAWIGSAAFAKYEDACDVLRELGVDD